MYTVIADIVDIVKKSVYHKLKDNQASVHLVGCDFIEGGHSSVSVRSGNGPVSCGIGKRSFISTDGDAGIALINHGTERVMNISVCDGGLGRRYVPPFSCGEGVS